MSGNVDACVTATDECGNASVEAEQYVQLYDDAKPVPVITRPADFTVDKDDDCNADVSVGAAGSRSRPRPRTTARPTPTSPS